MSIFKMLLLTAINFNVGVVNVNENYKLGEITFDEYTYPQQSSTLGDFTIYISCGFKLVSSPSGQQYNLILRNPRINRAQTLALNTYGTEDAFIVYNQTILNLNNSDTLEFYLQCVNYKMPSQTTFSLTAWSNVDTYYKFEYYYDLGYDEGTFDGYTEGYDDGEIVGYQKGLEDGKQFNLFPFISELFEGLKNLFDVQVFPNVSAWNILSIPLILSIFFLILKVFR